MKNLYLESGFVNHALWLTNADRIRAMTDEALAELFTHLCCPYSLGGKIECNIENKGCNACWLEWLRREVDT